MKDISLEESFGTLSETINGLVKAGYTHNLNVKEDCLICHQTNTSLSPDDFQIDKVYRFEGASDPEDEAVVYAISSAKFGIRGTLVNGYGVSFDEGASKLIEKLKTHKAASKRIRANEATTQRPGGDRVLDAALVEMDLNKFIDQVKNEKAWMEGDRNAVTIFKSDSMRIVLMGLHENAELKAHKANGVISVQLLEGKIEFVTADHKSVLAKGQMIALQKNVVHSVTALSESFFLLTLALEGNS